MRNRSGLKSPAARLGFRWMSALNGPVSALILGLTTTASLACGFHTYLPEKTVVDWIITSDHLIIARNSQENEFEYSVVETLRDSGRPVDITQLVDSGTRQRFAARKQDGSLFAFDHDKQSWRFVAYLTPDYRRLVDTVMENATDWGEEFHAERFKMFEALQDHPNEAIRMLALREIDQAPYALLRTMDVRFATEDLLAELWTREGYPYQPIRILLLGLSGDAEARSEIHEFIDRVAAWDWANNLGAYATALVEIDGTAGVEMLDARFLSDAGQPLDKLEQVIEALAIHNKVGAEDIRSAVSATITRLIALRPEAAPLVARQFGSREDWSQATPLATVITNQSLRRGEGFLRVAVYVAQARDGRRETAGPTLP